jgi:two-component system LytT family response regulator
MLKIIIADDVDNIRESLSEMIQQYSNDSKIVATTNSVKSTVGAINQYSPDVVLLDVEMGDGTGFDVLKQFPAPSFKVIFVSAYQNYAVEAFKFSALDYLLKPVDPNELIKAIHTASDKIDRDKLSLKIDSFISNIENLSKGPKKITLKTSDNIYVVNVQDIIYCESDHSYTKFHLNNGSHIMVSRGLGDYDEMLSPYNFMRIHQSYLVNLNFVSRYEKGDGGKIILSTNANLPVATRKKEQLLQVLSKL